MKNDKIDLTFNGFLRKIYIDYDEINKKHGSTIINHVLNPIRIQLYELLNILEQ